jgi:hypothetical protein
MPRNHRGYGQKNKKEQGKNIIKFVRELTRRCRLYIGEVLFGDMGDWTAFSEIFLSLTEASAIGSFLRR